MLTGLGDHARSASKHHEIATSGPSARPEQEHDQRQGVLARRGPRASVPAATHTDVLWLIVAILLSLATRIPFFTIPMIHDEGGYAYATRGWLEGTSQLYDDLWISRPQGIFVLYGAIFELLGTGVWALRFTAWIFAALTVVAVWLFGRRWTIPRIANFATVLSAIMLSWPNLEGFTANAEIFMGMPAAFATFWLLRQSQTRWSRAELVGVGLLIGLATVLKPSGIVMLFVAWGFFALLPGLDRRERLAMSGWVLVGTAIIGAITFIHGYTLGWDDFFYATISYRLTLQSGATVSLGHHLYQIGSLAYTIGSLLGMLLLISAFRILHPLRPATAVPASRPVPRLRWLQLPRDPGGQLLLLWVIGALLGIAIGGDWWSHYVIQIVPPLALWIAWNVDGIIRVVRGWRRVLGITMFALMVALPYSIVVDGYDAMLEWLYGHPGYPAQAEVAQYIRMNSDPDDTIYVAFDQASIYYLANRQPAYRHLYLQELRALPDSYADIIQIISGPDRPLYIVSTLHPGPFADHSRAFWREVGQYYDLETTIQGVPIYRAKDEPNPNTTP